MIFFLVFAAVATAAQLTTEFAEGTSEAETEAAVVEERLREGTVLKQVHGDFQLTGERVTFFSREGQSMRMLENLALERVTRILEDTPGKRTWVVDGVVTEFRGGNYLLITRAIIKRHTD